MALALLVRATLALAVAVFGLAAAAVATPATAVGYGYDGGSWTGTGVADPHVTSAPDLPLHGVGSTTLEFDHRYDRVSLARASPRPADQGHAPQTIRNAVPQRLARVVDADFVNAPRLGGPGAGRVFVTAADDLSGITSSRGLAERLTLLDDSFKQRSGPFAVFEFDTPASGLGSPVFRSNPGFVGFGRTAGGAREFDLPNMLFDDLSNVTRRIVE